MKALIVVCAIVVCASHTHAELVEEKVVYKHGDTELHGYLVHDDSIEGKRPGVLVVHEWWGLNEYAKNRAAQLAQLGYIALAVDMYGEGKSTEHPNEAREWATMIRQNQRLGLERFSAGYEVLKKHSLLDGGRMAAIGYCFGGSVVLIAALNNADVGGVVSFHGGLPTDPVEAKSITAKILVCHGAEDHGATAETVETFQNILRDVGADWEFITYGGAQHGFTNPGSRAYQEAADRRSWSDMRDFFDEIFAD
jgi:dienelactone hydrolase